MYSGLRAVACGLSLNDGCWGLITAERDGYFSCLLGGRHNGVCLLLLLVAVDGGPFGFGALEGSALGLQRQSAAAFGAAVAVAMVADVANFQAVAVVFFGDRPAAVGDEVGQGAGQVPDLARQDPRR